MVNHGRIYIRLSYEAREVTKLTYTLNMKAETMALVLHIRD